MDTTVPQSPATPPSDSSSLPSVGMAAPIPESPVSASTENPSSPPPSMTPPVSTSSTTPLTPPMPPKKKFPVVLVAIILLLLIGALSAGIVFMQFSGSNAAPTVTPTISAEPTAVATDTPMPSVSIEPTDAMKMSSGSGGITETTPNPSLPVTTTP